MVVPRPPEGINTKKAGPGSLDAAGSLHAIKNPLVERPNNKDVTEVPLAASHW
jgi:hypothetical protein